MELAIPSAAHIGAFAAAAFLLLLTPGPAVLYIVGRSVEQGRLAGSYPFSALRRARWCMWRRRSSVCRR